MSWLLLVATTSVLAVGDSHTAGVVAPPRGPAFPEVLGETLGPDFTVTAAGCPGSTVRDWTRQVKGVDCAVSNAYAEVAAPHLPVDIAVILLGTNDSVGFHEPDRVSAEEYAERMEALVSALRRDGVRRILLVGPPAYGDPIHQPEANRLLRAYTQALRQLAATRSDTSMGPALLELLSPEEHLPGAHINGAGHRLLGQTLAVALEPLAQSLAAEDARAAESSAAAEADDPSELDPVER